MKRYHYPTFDDLTRMDDDAGKYHEYAKFLLMNLDNLKRNDGDYLSEEETRKYLLDIANSEEEPCNE